MLKKGLIWILGICMMACSIQPQQTEEKRIRILSYCDSNTNGFDPFSGRYPKKKRWTSLLQNQLPGNVQVINEGRNGRTTAYDLFDDPSLNGASTLPDTLKKHPDCDLIIFMLGTNDCSLVRDADQIRQGMEQLLEIAQKEYPKPKQILLVTPAAIQSESPPGILSRQIAPYYQALAQKYSALYFDGTDAFELCEDGIHLSETGHRQVADALAECIKQSPIFS